MQDAKGRPGEDRGVKEWPGESRDAAMDLAVYGAGMVAMGTYCAIKSLYGACRIRCFIVSEKQGNPERIDNIPVISLEEFADPGGTWGVKSGEATTGILIATPENHHRAIIEKLEQRKLGGYIPIDSRTEAKLMERYYHKAGMFPSLRSYEIGGKKAMPKARMEVYMARSHKDRPLTQPHELPGWIHPIQAGAALTEERIAAIGDAMGENISEKNGNYCELSALYWIWKNRGIETGGEAAIEEGMNPDGRNPGARVKEDGTVVYLGLFHYRRILEVAEEDVWRMEEHGIDAVLPYPTVHYPSADEHHRRYVTDGDWEAMAQALEELDPGCEGLLSKMISQKYFYNYNMLIAKKNVFQEFCAWLFAILKRTEELSSPKGWQRSDRYIGYLGENLTTLYFMYRRGDLKIAHAGRLMLL